MNETRLTLGSVTIASPVSAPPITTWSRPSGRPASRNTASNIAPPQTGVCGSGLRTIEGLERNRERLLNRRLIQETMFNRFDRIIHKWTDHYNKQFSFTGADTLDPNLVKSMLFQESEFGTSGQHLQEPPRHRVKTRFNIGQVIDSSAPALLIMIREMEPSLLTTFHLTTINADLASAQRELQSLRRVRNRDPAQEARLTELRRLAGQNFEVFLWEYKASWRTEGFAEEQQLSLQV